MQMVLYADGIKIDSQRCDFVFKNLYDEMRLLNNAIERMKIVNQLYIRDAKEWQIFIIHKSKL